MPEHKLILGIDPGFSGALALYDPARATLLEVIDMPVTAVPGRPLRINTKGVVDFVHKYAGSIQYAVVEKVSSMPGQGVSSMFRFGYGAGILEGVLTALGVEIRYLVPSVWKMVLGLGSNKRESILLARKIFHEQTHLFRRAKDDGRAEAALMAYLGGLAIKGGKNL